MPLLLYLGLSFSAEAANHLGTSGELNWECELDIYGKIRKLKGDRSLIPFRFPGQYEDAEIGLYYNRFRYYSPDWGGYVSQDPIGLWGENAHFYAFVRNPGCYVDIFGLDELYALVAKKDGWYPVFEWGEKDPIGEIFLKKGELWKLGTSKNVSKRYSKTYLKRLGVSIRVLHTGITRQTSLFLENLKLRGYEAWKKFLPPGNKCRH